MKPIIIFFNVVKTLAVAFWNNTFMHLLEHPDIKALQNSNLEVTNASCRLHRSNISKIKEKSYGNII